MEIKKSPDFGFARKFSYSNRPISANFGGFQNPKKSLVDPLQPLDFKQFSKLIKQSRKISKAINRSI